MKPLNDFRQDIDRLLVAGSKFAKNDPRLSKHLAILNALGEKVPVFKRMAQQTEVLLHADADTSASMLLELTNLLYAVLYTQSDTAPIDNPVRLTPVLPQQALITTATYKQLRPVIEALTNAPAGRYDTVLTAFKAGMFGDFRLFAPLNRGLEDSYSELTDLIETQIIPSVGEAMIPMILKSFVIDNRKPNLRRLRLLNNLGYKERHSLALEVLKEAKSSDWQAQAVTMLSDDIQYLDFLCTLTTDRHKVVSEAANRAVKLLKAKIVANNP
ncbi:MAG: hypothetical protein LBM62_04915 [Mediterranea sp.]|jgi:hypothetical protein|nr:hypothetical protein [Mediterranea sp.]